MFNSTLTGNARVWFDDLPKESIDSYDDLKKAFLENYLQQKKCIKDPVEIHNIRQRDGEATKELVRRKQIKEMLKEGKLSHLIKELKQNNEKEQPKVTKKEETSGKDKALAILMGEDEGTERYNDHRGGKIGGTVTPFITLRFGLDKLRGCKITISIQWDYWKTRSQKITSSSVDSSQNAKDPGTPSATKPIIEERVKVAINPEYPEQTVMIGSTLTEEGRNKLCNLLQRNLGIFSWKPADMTGIPRHIAEHRLNVQEGCSLVGQKKRGQAADRNQAIHEERMCVDFKDLNKACPKDGYRLPEIDWKVESLCGFPFKCFLDAYKVYHQIQMAKEDEEKTAFITSQKIFCYTKMPFGLRNAGITYQRLVDKAFHKQIGRNLEVYVDDLVIKSRTEDEIVRDIEETFKTLREINMKLNPKKCTFGVEEGMFLGYKVNTKGLTVCPDKMDAVLSLPSPKCLKDVQKLNGKLASLNRFLARSAEKSLPFFKTLKKCMKKSDFHWTTEAEEAFKQMKQLIAELPMLTAPMEKEELIFYLAAAKEKSIKGSGNKLYINRKVSVGFGACHSREATEMELGEYTIHYRPIVSVKGQILADFIVEQLEEDSPDTLMEEAEELPKPWILFTDESSCTDGFGAGLILTNPEGIEFTYALRFMFDATNNEAEYEALISGLKIEEQMGVKNLQANVDSRLVANQVPRSENKKADALSKIASTSFAHLSKQVLVEELKEKSISATEVLAVVEEEGDTWMTPIFKYLTDGTLPAEGKKARVVRRKSWRFAIINGTLYKKSFLGPWLRFGLPGEIISDNGKQFQDNPFKDWYEKLCIHQHFASVKHPQTNGLVERANRSLGEGIKARLEKRRKNLMKELPHVLWAHRTMIKSSNEDTPFSLTYGTKTVILVEIGMPTQRTTKVDLTQKNEALEINLDLLEEIREQATIREAKSKQNGKVLQLQSPKHKF
ncbi:reverse transcriptase domain-containing protein [Tanacetum coccineum]